MRGGEIVRLPDFRLVAPSPLLGSQLQLLDGPDLAFPYHEVSPALHG
jgi:hypothetical protein